MSNELDDYRWLTSDDAVPWLADAVAEQAHLVTFTQRLRHQFSPQRTHLIIEQAELRHRAREKFSQADRLFFTRQSLEQATDERVAAYKAERIAGCGPVADYCCGIGGDLMALAANGSATGVDSDPVVALFAEANCRAIGQTNVQVEVSDVRAIDVGRFGAWHLDPDRRSSGRRTTQIEMYEPPLAWIDENRQINPNLAVKLAPATMVPESWSSEAELCWIGSRRECRQQVAWWGKLARHPGRRTTVVFAGSHSGQSETPSVFVGEANEGQVPIATIIGRYVYEPHSAILAAGLGDCLASQRNLLRLCEMAPYFTSDHCEQDPLLDGFEVRDVLPLDTKKLNAALSAFEIGDVEIKKRGIDVTPEQLRKRLRLSGTNRGTLIIVPTDPVRVILATRMLGRAEELDARKPNS